MALSPDEIQRVLQDPDISNVFMEEFAKARFEGYRAGIRKGVELAHRNPYVPLESILSAINTVDQAIEIEEILNAHT